MAVDLKLSALFAGNEALTLAGSDYAYGIVGGASKAWKFDTLAKMIAIGTIALAAGTITSITPVPTLSATWNNASGVFVGFRIAITDTASHATAKLAELTVGGSPKVDITKVGDIRVYNAFTDTSNYERGFFKWSGNTLDIGAEAAGTGSSRSTRVRSGASSSLLLNAGGSDRWVISSTGNLQGNVDATYDIGANGSNRPRDLWLSRSFSVITGAGIGGAAVSSTFLAIVASTTAKSHMNLAAGVAPTSPINGDFWFDGSDLKMRAGGVTYTFTKT